MDSLNLIETKNLSYTIKGQQILKPLSFTIHKRALTVILGPNGAGKSTLLDCLAGLKRSTQVFLEGGNVTDFSVDELSRYRAWLGAAEQSGFAFSVREVIEMGRNPWKGLEDKNLFDRAVEDAIKQLDLEALKDRSVTTLSAGEAQRVHLARVWAQMAGVEGEKPAWLFLDEPLTHLDPKHQEDLLKLLRGKIETEGWGVVVVLHDVSLALRYADDVLLMKDGSLVANGPVRSTITGDVLKDVYGQEYESLRNSTGQEIWVPV